MDKGKNASLRELMHVLGTVLDASNGLTQQEIAELCGVDQGFISRVKNGGIVRETKRTITLRQVLNSYYANMRKRRVPRPNDVEVAVENYLAGGGNPDLLVRQLELLRAAQARATRAARPRHRDRGK